MRALGFEAIVEVIMSPDAKAVLEQLRSLPRHERLAIIAQVMQDPEPSKATLDTGVGLWADIDDEEYDSFLRMVLGIRRADES